VFCFLENITIGRKNPEGGKEGGGVSIKMILLPFLVVVVSKIVYGFKFVFRR